MVHARVGAFLAEVMRRVRRGGTPSREVQDLKRPDLYFEEVRLHHPADAGQGPYLMPLVTLRTPACGWSRTAGCTMCGYSRGASGQRNSRPEDLIAQTRWAIERLDPRRYHTLVFTSNGSFLDPVEVPDAVRPQLLGMLYAAGFRFVVVETRPAFVTPGRLDALLAVVPGGERGETALPLSFSFGVESHSEFILATAINKGNRTGALAGSAALIRGKGFSIDSYVLLGKPFLSAREDVADAVETIRWAHGMGADYLFVMVSNRVAGTLIDHMMGRGSYSLPSLWRAVKLLEMLPDDLRRLVQVKGISHAPYPPMEYASSCPSCRGRVVQGLNFWNQTGDFGHIRELPDCACRERFEREEWADSPTRTLPERVHGAYGRLAGELDIAVDAVPELAELTRLWRVGNP